MLNRTYVATITAYYMFAIGIIYGFPVYTIDMRGPGTAPFVVSCYNGHATATESNGSRACSVWSFTNACVKLLFRVNRGESSATPAYAAVGKELGNYSETTDLYLTIEICLMLGALAATWMYYLREYFRWLQLSWFLLAAKVLLGMAHFTALLLYMSTARVMNELQTDSNTFAGQRVYWDWGYVMSIAFPLTTLLIHSTITLYLS